MIATMLRTLVVISLLATTARAETTVPAAKAKSANHSAFSKALVKLKLKTLALKGVPADPGETSDDTHFVTNVVSSGQLDNDPTFAVDAKKIVYRVVRKLNAIGRARVRVCRAIPRRPDGMRVVRRRFDLPKGHTFSGDVEVSYDGYVLDETNTCRQPVR
jgi:hypothetical protein